MLPLIVGAVLWLACYPVLVHISVTNPAQSGWHLAGQALLVGGAVYLSLKYFLPAFLLLHLIASYVFLGDNPFWEYVNSTARRMLVPLRRVPLRIGKVDLAPVVAMVMILFFLNLVPLTRWVCRAYFPKSAAQQELSRWVIWPR